MRRFRLTSALLVSGIAIASSTAVVVSREAPPATAKLPDLLKARLHTATESRRVAEQQFEQGTAAFGDVLTWSRREIEAGLDLAATKADRLALLERYVEQARHEEAVAARRAAAGIGSTLDVHSAQYERLGAEVRLARAQSE